MIHIIKQADITQDLLSEIVRLKTATWNYPHDKQVEWIYTHLKSNDSHVILRKEKEGVAYLNLVQVAFLINGNNINGCGIGNVCSRHKGMGYGIKLMNAINNYLEINKQIGFLLCREKLVDFYKKTGWITIEQDKLFVDFDYTNIVFMIYNFNDEINRFEYSGSAF